MKANPHKDLSRRKNTPYIKSRHSVHAGVKLKAKCECSPHKTATKSGPPAAEGSADPALSAKRTNTYILVLTGLRLFGSIQSLLETYAEKAGSELSKKLANVNEEERQRIQDVFANYPEFNTIGDPCAGKSDCLRLVQWMASRNDLRLLTDGFEPMFRKTGEILQLVAKLLFSGELSQSQMNVSGLPQYCDCAEKLLSDGPKHLAKSWNRCEVACTSACFTVRDPLAKNLKYNPKGITLQCVLHEITAAMERNTVFPSIVEAVSYWLKVKDVNWMDDTARQYEQYIRLSGSRSTIDDEKDPERLRFIVKYPSALLLSPEHQDAAARWLYAARCGMADDRKLGKKNLELSLGHRKTAGRYQLNQVNPVQLLQAYQDLLLYIKGFTCAAKELKNESAVLGIFPDSEFLFLDFINGDWKSHFSSHVKRRIKTKAPTDLAIEFIARHSGLYTTRIEELLQQTRDLALPK